MWYEHLLHFLHLSESPSTVMELRITRRSTLAMLRVRGRTSRGAGPACLSDIKVACSRLLGIGTTSSAQSSTCGVLGEKRHGIVGCGVGDTTDTGMLNGAFTTGAAAAGGGLCSMYCLSLAILGSLMRIDVTVDWSLAIMLYCAVERPSIFVRILA